MGCPSCELIGTEDQGLVENCLVHKFYKYKLAELEQSENICIRLSAFIQDSYAMGKKATAALIYTW